VADIGRARNAVLANVLEFTRVEAPAFDEHASRAMGEAFASACAKLHDSNLSKPLGEIIAERLIEAAKRGECDPERLCSIAIAAMDGERKEWPE
jgi:hypothetical protein